MRTIKHVLAVKRAVVSVEDKIHINVYQIDEDNDKRNYRVNRK
jgi:hypothetical protein